MAPSKSIERTNDAILPEFGGERFRGESEKKIRKIDGCSRERAQYSEPTTTTVRNLKKERNEMDQQPRTEMHT